MPNNNLSTTSTANSVSSCLDTSAISGFSDSINHQRALMDAESLFADPFMNPVGGDCTPFRRYGGQRILKAGATNALLTGSQAHRGAALNCVSSPSNVSNRSCEIGTLAGAPYVMTNPGAGDAPVVNEGLLLSPFSGEDWSSSPLFPNLPDSWDSLPTAMNPARVEVRGSTFTSTSTKRSHDGWDGPDSKTASTSSLWTDGSLDLRPPGSSGARKRCKRLEQPRRTSEAIAFSNQALILGRTADRKELSRSLVNTYLDVVHAQYPVSSVTFNVLYRCQLTLPLSRLSIQEP